MRLVVVLSLILFSSLAASWAKLTVDEAVDEIRSHTNMRFYDWMTPAGQKIALTNTIAELRDVYDQMAEDSAELKKQDRKVPQLGAFPCNLDDMCDRKSNYTEATSVHKLRARDIGVIGALGDSLTAGTGVDARTIIGLLFQYRGKTFDMGGVGNFESNPTLPNILRKCNSDLKGFSTGTCKFDQCCAHLNVAVPGETSRELMTQAQVLVSRIKSEPAYMDKWKFITIFMGNNDICHSCKEPAAFTVKLFRQRISDTLNYLKANLPKTFVSLVTLMDVQHVRELNGKFTCGVIHHFECSCAAYPDDEQHLVNITAEFQQEMEDLVNKDECFDSDDFAAVVQPFFKKTVLPLTPSGNPDLSYFAPDCFHLSGKAEEQATMAYWNSLLQPIGQKKENWFSGETYLCPSDKYKYFATRNCHK